MWRESYLIEFRLNGRAKKFAKNLIFEVSNKFRVKGVTHKHPVPHISLFGPFKTNNPKAMVNIVKNVCKKYDMIGYKINGFNYFNNPKNKVVYLEIKPTKELEELRWEISNKLVPHCQIKNNWDRDKNFDFHATIAFKDIDRKFQEIINFLQNKEKPKIWQYVVRVSIIKNGLIMYEYDFMQKRLLNRHESKNKKNWSQSIDILKEKRKNLPKNKPITKGVLEEIKDQFSELLKWISK